MLVHKPPPRLAWASAALRQAFRESGDLTGRKQGRSPLFSIRLILLTGKCPVGSFFCFSTCRGASASVPSRRVSTLERSRRPSGGGVARFFKSTTWKRNEQAPSSRSERDRAANARVSRCRSSTRSWPAGPPCWRSTPATAATSPRSPRRCVCVPTFRLVGEGLGATRRATTRLEARDVPREARAPATPRASRAWARFSRGRPPPPPGCRAVPPARRGREEGQTAHRECIFFRV